MILQTLTSGQPCKQGVLASGAAPIMPLPRSPPTYWFWNELGEFVFGALPRAWSDGDFFADARRAGAGMVARLLGGVDAVLDPADPLPFLALHYGQAGTLPFL